MIINHKKSLGQNFLIDKNILKKISNSTKIDAEDEILEIGPGTGNLTEFLVKKKPKKIYLIEKDEKLINILKKKFIENVNIINDDISFGHARALVTLSENQANEVTDQIIDRHLSVRNTEKLVNNLKRVAKTGVGAKSLGRQKDANIEFIEKELTSLLGLNVVISHKANNSGHMDIFYRNLDQLQPIIDKLKWRPK